MPWARSHDATALGSAGEDMSASCPTGGPASVTDMSVGPLVPADELFVHQVADTFGTVGQADRSWTEKLWAVASAPDGSLQVDLGLGLYPNRGVIDGYAGVSRGVEQWTVRA